ncbi:MAG: glutathione-disulfide reductase [Hydrogenophilaceae bacterium]|jgi:glutathione reductase (NADPH)|nr:glutathione-disulfide reductase [Hydrogenophilaceae bacterium]
MANYDYDLFVIGAGSGGVRAARLAAQSGARVAIAEEHRIGGTCVIRGCVPKKLLVYGGEFGQAFEDARAFGWSADNVRFDWRTLRDNVQAEVTRLSGLYRANLERAGVAIFEERAAFVDPHRLQLGRSGRVATAEKILIATGGRARPLACVGADLAISSNEAFLLDALPKSIAIVGGGYVAAEFATIFSSLGVETTILYRGAQILRGFDDDIRAFAAAEMQRTGVAIRCSADLDSIAREGDGFVISLRGGETLRAGLVMAAIGRDANADGLNLEAAGVARTMNGQIAVDDYNQSSAPHIFALGDVANRLQLTPVAIREGQAFAETQFYGRPAAFDHADVPTAVFCRPPIATVGLTQHQAEEKFGAADIYKADFRPMKHILAGNPERALMKLVVHPVTDQVLGAHMVGRDAPEIVQMAAIAVKAGITKTQWDATCALHPTAAEEFVLLREKAR